MAEKNLRPKMEAAFSRSGLSLTPRQCDLFWRFYELFDRYNDEYDLSRIKRFDDIVLKHFVDSALVATMIDLPSPLLDIGTGAGFPGIPLRIMSPGTSIILAEPKDKRVLFMEMIIKEFGFENARVYPHRVGDHSDFEVAGVITRAFEQVDGTLSRVAHFLPKGGRVIFMKGPAADEDMGQMSDENRRAYKIVRDDEYFLPGTKHVRRLLVFEKTDARMKRVHTVTDTKYAAAVISSADNATFKELKKLTESKGIRKAEKTLVAGKKIIKELWDRNPSGCGELILFDEYRESDEDFNDLIARFRDAKKLVLLKRSLFAELDVLEAKAPLCVVAAHEPAAWTGSAAAGCTVAVPFQDPANVGAVIRSAAAFGARVLLLEGSANPWHPKSVRSSGGAVFSVEMLKGPSLEECAALCRQKKIPLFALDMQGKDIRSAAFPESFILLPGVEGPGVPQNTGLELLSIPIEPEVESLNAAVAAAIALFQWKSGASK
jgi:16S rRNA (guanine527-N7)-methyltransferase